MVDRRWSMLISTITPVPPAIGVASGCWAFAASASPMSQVGGSPRHSSLALLQLALPHCNLLRSTQPPEWSQLGVEDMKASASSS